MINVAEYKAGIAERASQALLALAAVAEATAQLDALLYGIPYRDELHPIHTQVTETAWRALGDFESRELRVALTELKEEMTNGA